MNDSNLLNIPDDWSGQQALAVFDFLDKLRQKIWLEYQEEIILELRSEMDKTDLDMDNSESLEFDDDIDF